MTDKKIKSNTKKNYIPDMPLKKIDTTPTKEKEIKPISNKYTPDLPQKKSITNLEPIKKTNNQKRKKKIKVLGIKKKTTTPPNKLKVINIKKKKNNLIWLSALLIFICIFCFSLFKIISWQLDNKNYQKIETNILKDITITEVTTNTEETTIVNSPTSESDIYWKYLNTSLIDVDFTDLKKQNKDTIGWLQVPGTLINYPIVQTKDNKYYLNHDFVKDYNSGGWIFLDYRNNINNLSANNIIYGHERFNNSMFGSLKNVLTKNWLNNTDNHVIKISTPESNYLFQIFSVYSIPNENYYIQTTFTDTQAHKEFLDTITNRSIHDFKTEVNEETKILTLSTCYNDNDRLVVHSKLIKIAK